MYEGYALAVEELRAAVDWEREQGDPGARGFVSPSDDAPFHPYKVLRWVYDSIAGSLDRRWDSVAEFMIVLDTVLMYDAFLTGSRQATVDPMRTFIMICDHIGRHRQRLSLKDWESQNVAAFQNALLRAIDAPVPSVERPGSSPRAVPRRPVPSGPRACVGCVSPAGRPRPGYAGTSSRAAPWPTRSG